MTKTIARGVALLLIVAGIVLGILYRHALEQKSMGIEEDNGVCSRTLNVHLSADEKTMSIYRNFLCKIGVVERVKNQQAYDVSERLRLTPKITRLYSLIQRDGDY